MILLITIKGTEQDIVPLVNPLTDQDIAPLVSHLLLVIFRRNVYSPEAI